MADVKSEFLFTMTAELARETVQELSGTPHGTRRIFHVKHGSFDQSCGDRYCLGERTGCSFALME